MDKNFISRIGVFTTAAFLALVFSMVSCGGKKLPTTEGEGIMAFSPGNIFLGMGEDGKVLVEAHFRSQRLEDDKVILQAMFLPTEDFDFEEEYRGFSRISYYKIKDDTPLDLTLADTTYRFKTKDSHTTRSIEPFDIEFERKKMVDFVPDTIDSMWYPFKGVSRWERVKKEDVAKWSKSKEAIRAEAKRRREARKRKEEFEKGAPGTASPEGGMWVSVNATYVFEERDTGSRIIAKLPLGTHLEMVKVSNPEWYEVSIGEPPVTGFVPALMLSSTEHDALAWEEEMSIAPVTTPLEPAPDSLEEGN
jgi:hypothetical protein